MKKNTVKKAAVKKTAKISPKPLSIDKKNNLFVAGTGASAGGLEDAIQKARLIKNEVQTMGIDIKVNDHFQTINLKVKPVLSKETDLGADKNKMLQPIRHLKKRAVLIYLLDGNVPMENIRILFTIFDKREPKMVGQHT